MIFVAVNKAGVVMSRCKSLCQLGANFKQRVVRDFLRLGVIRIKVVAGVVILPPPFVLKFLSRQVPRLGHLVFTL